MFFDIGKAKVKVTCDNAVTDALVETSLTEKSLVIYNRHQGQTEIYRASLGC